jgi:hypothetical protein
MHGIVGLNLILIDFCTQRLHGNALMILGVKLTAVLLHLIGVPDVRAIFFFFLRKCTCNSVGSQTNW